LRNQTLLAPNQLVWGLGETVGSPSVTLHEPHDANANLLLMVYETQYEAPSAVCPAGRWGIGLAYRANGSNTRALNDAGPVVVPAPNTYYSCVAAHPTIVQLSNGNGPFLQSWLVYFKAEQECDPADAACERYTGLGQMVIFYNSRTGSTYNYTITAPNITPVLTDVAQDMGYPKAAFFGGQYRIAFAQFPDIYLASSPLLDDFPTPTTPVVTAGTPAAYGDDELLSPALLCDDNSLLSLYPVGRSWDVSPSMLTDVSVGGFNSTDASTFTEINPLPYLSTLAGDPEARHVHVSSSNGRSGYAMYFSTPNGSGGNSIRYADTASFTWEDTDSRRCP
jgi:hypothetical protein